MRDEMAKPRSCRNVGSSADAPSNPGGSVAGAQYRGKNTLRPIASVATARYGRCFVRALAQRVLLQFFACRSNASSSPGPASDGTGSGFANAGEN